MEHIRDDRGDVSLYLQGLQLALQGLTVVEKNKIHVTVGARH